MIHSITAYTGDSPFARYAQEYAMDLAERYRALLRIATIWEPGAEAREQPTQPDPATLVEADRERLVEEARKRGIVVSQSERGDGLLRGLLQEAQSTDLLVLGMPTLAQESDNGPIHRMFKDEKHVLRQAECPLLVVDREFQPPTRMLVQYQRGLAGKAAIRMAGELAQHYHVPLSVLSLSADVAHAGATVGIAQHYLEAFDIPEVSSLPLNGPTDSPSVLLENVERQGVDFLVMGDEGDSVLERFFGMDVAAQVATLTTMPLLIAR